MSTFPGIIPAVVVPFADDDSIDVDALRANVSHLIEGGVHGLVVNGTMGEAGTLSDEERGLVIDTVVAVGRRPPARDRRRLVGLDGGVVPVRVAGAERRERTG